MGKRSKIIYRIIIAVLCIVIGVSLYKIGSIIHEYYEGAQAYKEIRGSAVTIENLEEKIDFDALREQNEDIRAWLCSKDTVIDYPVVQGPDNDYYLYRMFNREWNGRGTLFIDYRCEHPFEDFNTIIYGHRMKDGSMFHSLIDYRDKDYYNEHKTMNLKTPDKEYTVHVFSVNTIPADSSLYRISFDSDEEKEEYIRQVKESSETPMDVEVTAGDKIIMMSTCTYEFDDARLVVYGKLEEKKD